MRCAACYGSLVLAVFATLTYAAESAAAEPGEVPTGTLAQFGIPGLQPMSDAEGEQVRGSGFVWVGSFSYALGRVDVDTATSTGAPRLATSSESRSFSFGGFSYSASSRGFAFGAAR